MTSMTWDGVTVGFDRNAEGKLVLWASIGNVEVFRGIIAVKPS